MVVLSKNSQATASFVQQFLSTAATYLSVAWHGMLKHVSLLARLYMSKPPLHQLDRPPPDRDR